jgi:hypothetical protein
VNTHGREFQRGTRIRDGLGLVPDEQRAFSRE